MERKVSVEFVDTGRKHSRIAHDGYLFVFNKKLISGSSYRCDRQPGCSARIHLKECGAILYNQHSHSPNYGRIALAKIIARGQQLARESHLSTAQIVDEMKIMYADIKESGREITQIGTDDSLKRMIRNHMKKARENSTGRINQDLLASEAYQCCKDILEIVAQDIDVKFVPLETGGTSE